MKLSVAAGSDVGRVRSHNEDAYVAELPLIAVADGVGGHNAGEIASALAVEVLESWRERFQTEGPAKLRDAALAAHRTIYSRAMGDERLRGMATTLTAAWVEGGSVTLAHVGDSRAYLLREGELSQLTVDHTLVQSWVDQGLMTSEDIRRHPSRNYLIQALGGELEVVVDMLSIDLRPGDRLLLASDGLTDDLTDDDIRDALASEPEGEAACRKLVARANGAGGNDNVTVVVLDASEEGPAPDEPSIVDRVRERFRLRS